MTQICRMVVIVARCSLLLLAGLWGSDVQRSFGQAPVVTIKLDASTAARVDRLAYSPDGKLLAALVDTATDTGGAELFLYDAEKRVLSGRLPLAAGCSGGGLAFTPDGKQIITSALPNLGGDPSIEFWDVATRKRVAHITLKGAGRVRGEIAPDGKTIALMGEVIRLFDLRSGKEMGTLYRGEKKLSPEPSKQPSYTTCLAFSSDSKSLAAGFSDSHVALWDVPKKKCLWSIRRGGNDMSIKHIALSPDGTRVASVPDSGGRSRMTVHGGKDGREEAAINYGHFGVYSLNPWIAFSSDGISVLLAARPKGLVICRWDIKENALYSTKPPEPGAGVRCIARSADGKRLVTGHDVIHVWDVTKIDTRLQPR